MDDTDTLLRISIVVGLAVLIVPLLLMSFMLLMGPMMGPMGAPTLLGVVPLLLVLGIGYGGYRFLKRNAESDETVSDGDSDPIERLKERYTNGELTEAEFEQKLDQQLDSGSRSKPTSETPVDAERDQSSEFEQ